MCDDGQSLVAVDRAEQLPTLPVAELAQDRSYADASRAASARKAYEADWRAFSVWCRERGLDSLPAEPRVVAVFLSAEASRGCAPLTVGRRLAAIGWMHKRAGRQPPQKREGAAAIAEVLAGIRRSRTSPPIRKAAAEADITWRLLHYIKGDRLRDHRDRALIAVGMAAALRRAELVALRMEDLKRVPEGLRIRVSRSKTDQEGVGQTIAVPHGRRLRPVALLDIWLQAAGISGGFLFRRFISKADRLSEQPMDDAAVALVVKRRAAAAGLTAKDFSGHSLRAGFLTAAAAARASLWKMQEVSRHKSVQVLSGYVRSAGHFEDHAGDDFL